MRKKLTIGIQLDPQIQSMLVKATVPWKNLPIHWYAQDSLYVRIMDLGWVDEDALNHIMGNLHVSVSAVQAFDIEMLAIEPQLVKDDMTTPRRIRWRGKESDELRRVYDDIRDALSIPHAPSQTFVPYVELGRVQQFNWKEQEIDVNVTKSFPIMLDVVQITLFETVAHEGKTLHEPIDIIDLI